MVGLSLAKAKSRYPPLYKLLVSKRLLLLNIPSTFIKHVAQLRIFISHLRPLQRFHFQPTTKTVKKIRLLSIGAWLAQSAEPATLDLGPVGANPHAECGECSKKLE